MKRKKEIGKVVLVGAGPGDPGLLTLKGFEALQKAEALVYDWLVHPELARWAPQAEKIYVGKKGGASSVKQEEIHRILLRLARRGKQVVRLKGGDPFLFGRGGEEAGFLARHKIPFEVVPGVSAGTGAPAYAGIPLTDRRLASQVTFVTGHEDPAKPSPAIDWKNLAAAKGTLVFFMGARNLSQIVQRLIRGGKPSRTSTAVIEWGTFPRQRVVTGTLETIVKKCRTARVEAPALLVIGEVVRLRRELDWFRKKPLYGKTVLVTRARAQASELARQLARRGARVLEFPAIEILPPSEPRAIDREINRLSRYDWAVFTSANGVQSFFGRVKQLERDARIFSGTRVAAIGEKTAEALLHSGIRPDLVPRDFTTAALFRALKRAGEIRRKKFLLARADIAPPDLRRSLEKEGGQVTEIEAYRTRPAPGGKNQLLDWIKNQSIDYVTFTSASTVENFFKPIPALLRKRLRARFVTIGPVTSAKLKTYGFRPDREARVHSIEGLVAALANGNAGGTQ